MGKEADNSGSTVATFDGTLVLSLMRRDLIVTERPLINGAPASLSVVDSRRDAYEGAKGDARLFGIPDSTIDEVHKQTVAAILGYTI